MTGMPTAARTPTWAATHPCPAWPPGTRARTHAHARTRTRTHTANQASNSARPFSPARCCMHGLPSWPPIPPSSFGGAQHLSLCLLIPLSLLLVYQKVALQQQRVECTMRAPRQGQLVEAMPSCTTSSYGGVPPLALGALCLHRCSSCWNGGQAPLQTPGFFFT